MLEVLTKMFVLSFSLNSFYGQCRPLEVQSEKCKLPLQILCVLKLFAYKIIFCNFFVEIYNKNPKKFNCKSSFSILINVKVLSLVVLNKSSALDFNFLFLILNCFDISFL
jgi:hypothetical protein